MVTRSESWSSHRWIIDSCIISNITPSSCIICAQGEWILVISIILGVMVGQVLDKVSLLSNPIVCCLLAKGWVSVTHHLYVLSVKVMVHILGILVTTSIDFACTATSEWVLSRGHINSVSWGEVWNIWNTEGISAFRLVLFEWNWMCSIEESWIVVHGEASFVVICLISKTL